MCPIKPQPVLLTLQTHKHTVQVDVGMLSVKETHSTVLWTGLVVHPQTVGMKETTCADLSDSCSRSCQIMFTYTQRGRTRERLGKMASQSLTTFITGATGWDLRLLNYEFFNTFRWRKIRVQTLDRSQSKMLSMFLDHGRRHFHCNLYLRGSCSVWELD